MRTVHERLDQWEEVMWGDGSGKPGVLGRLDRLEQKDIQANLTARDRQLIYYGPIVSGVLLAILWTILTAIVKHYFPGSV